MVARASPVASATRMIPPLPSDRASTAAQRRRARSSSSGLRVMYFASTIWVSGFGMSRTVTTYRSKRAIYFGEPPYVPTSTQDPGRLPQSHHLAEHLDRGQDLLHGQPAAVLPER